MKTVLQDITGLQLDPMVAIVFLVSAMDIPMSVIPLLVYVWYGKLYLE